jgi:hypothetical protein
VTVVIHVLEIEKKQIGQERYGKYCVTGSETGSVDRPVVAFISASFETRDKKIRVSFGSKWLSSGKGDATTRFIVEDTILVQLRHEIVNRVCLAHQSSRTGRASLGASPALPALADISTSTGISVQRFSNSVRTILETGFTSDATLSEQGNHGFGITTFRIVAPPTLQWAALQEHRRTDSRAIMDGKPLDIEYDSCVHQIHPLLLAIESSWV